MRSRTSDNAKPSLLTSTYRNDMTETTFRQEKHFNKGYEINALHSILHEPIKVTVISIMKNEIFIFL